MKKFEQYVMIFILFVLSIGIGLAYIQARSSAPSAPPATPKPVTVAVIGDSITEGISDVNDPRHNESYPTQLQMLLGDSYRVINYGASGRTLLDSGDLPYTQSGAFITSHQASPNIVLIMLGTNDSKPQNWNAREYESQLTKFIAGYKNLPTAPAVYLLTPPAAFINDIDVNGEVIEREIVPRVSRVATKLQLKVIDIFATTKGHPDYFPDGVHPNASASQVVAETIHTALKETIHK
jgi:lysophospholipase L1-like esterase